MTVVREPREICRRSQVRYASVLAPLLTDVLVWLYQKEPCQDGPHFWNAEQSSNAHSCASCQRCIAVSSGLLPPFQN